MSDKTKKILIFFCLCTLLPYILISFYSRPNLDDFCYSYKNYEIINDGKGSIVDIVITSFENTLWFYTHMNGIYISPFLQSLQPGIFSAQLYFGGSLLLMGILFVSIYYLVCKIRISRKDNFLLISVIAFVFIMHGLPSLCEGIYWYNGAWNYMFFFCIILFNLGVIIKYFATGKGLIISCILSFIGSGGNYVPAFLNIAILLIAGLYGLTHKKICFLWSTAVAIGGFCMNFFSPGTANRIDMFEHRSVIKTLIVSAFRCYEDICTWVDIRWVLMILLLIPLAVIIKAQCNILSFNPVFLIFISGIIYCGMLCVPYYGMGNFGPPRVENILWLTFMFLSAFNWVYFLVWFMQRINSVELEKLFLSKTYNLVIVICVLGVCFNRASNILTVTKQLVNGNAKEFAQTYDERCEIILETEEGAEVCVDPLPYCSTLYIGDITDDVTDWKNMAWEQYYGAKIYTQ